MTDTPRGKTRTPRSATTAPKASAKGVGGRPSKATQARVEAILKSIRHGASRTAAAAAAGVSKDAMRRWLERDPRFADKVAMAEGAMVTSLVDVVYESAQTKTKNGDPVAGAWIAAMTLLERRMPEDWGRRDRVDISMDIRLEAKRIAQENGLEESEVIAEAERYIRESARKAPAE